MLANSGRRRDLPLRLAPKSDRRLGFPIAALRRVLAVLRRRAHLGWLLAGAVGVVLYPSAYYPSMTLAGVAVGNVVAYEKEQHRAEELAQIDRAKTAFFSNVSHEFRTPLTLILGPLDDALNDRFEPLGAVQRQRIGATQRNALRLLKLVNSLLDFSRIEAGRLGLKVPYP